MRHFNKLFVIGLSRTGTSSVTAALNDVGIQCVHFPSIEENILKGDYELDVLETNRALSDTPIVPIYKQLDRQYPNSLFILTTRNESEWLKSCKKYFQHKDEAELSTDLEELNTFHRVYTYGCAGFNEEKFRQVFRDHEQDVIQYFSQRADDLLTIDVGKEDAWGKFCQFLEVGSIKGRFPELNNIDSFTTKLQQRQSRQAIATVTDPDFLPITEFMIANFLDKNPWFKGDIKVIVRNRAIEDYKRLLRFPNAQIVQASKILLKRIDNLTKQLPTLSGISERFLTLEVFGLIGYEVVVFLDSDILFLDSIKELFHQKGALSCAPDSCFYRDAFRDSNTHEQIAHAFTTSYGKYIKDSFNSGVMAIRAPFLSKKVHAELCEAVEMTTWEGIKAPKLADQIILNRYFEGRYSRLSSQYNFVVFLDDKIREKEGITYLDARIIHYAGPHKPWQSIVKSHFDFKLWKHIELWRTELKKYTETLTRDGRRLFNSKLSHGLYIAEDIEEINRYVKNRVRMNSFHSFTGKELRKMRKERGLSGKRLANKIRIDEAKLRAFEKSDELLPSRLSARAKRILAKHTLLAMEWESISATNGMKTSRFGNFRRKLVLLGLIVIAVLKNEDIFAQESTAFDPSKILEGGVVTSTHEQHQSRTKPSAGVDIDAPHLNEGSKAPVKSMTDGKVTAVNPRSGFVQITDGDGYKHEYVHLNLSEPHVKEGQTVKAGDQIAALGNTGTTKDHVHYQVKSPTNSHVNPQSFTYTQDTSVS